MAKGSSGGCYAGSKGCSGGSYGNTTSAYSGGLAGSGYSGLSCSGSPAYAGGRAPGAYSMGKAAGSYSSLERAAKAYMAAATSMENMSSNSLHQLGQQMNEKYMKACQNCGAPMLGTMAVCPKCGK